MSDNQEIHQDPATEQAIVAQKFDWRKLLDRISYGGIVNNVPYLAFVVLLCVFYIANNHAAIETQRELDKQQKLLKELHWQNMDIKSKLMNAGMEAEIIKRGATIGMKPLMLPAYKIVIDSTQRGTGN